MLRHLDLGWIKKDEQNRIRYPNGQTITSSPGVSKWHAVEQANRQKPGLIPASKVPAAAMYQGHDLVLPSQSNLMDKHYYQTAQDREFEKTMHALWSEWGSERVDQYVLVQQTPQALEDDLVLENFH